MSSRHAAAKTYLIFAVTTGLVLASAVAGNAFFGARGASAATVDASVNAAVNAATGGEGTPLGQAAAGAETVAKSAGLRTAVAGAWRTAWEKSWPFIKGSILKFFGLLGQAWASIAGSISTGGTNANVSTNAAVNASVNAAP